MIGIHLSAFYPSSEELSSRPHRAARWPADGAGHTARGASAPVGCDPDGPVRGSGDDWPNADDVHVQVSIEHDIDWRGINRLRRGRF